MTDSIIDDDTREVKYFIDPETVTWRPGEIIPYTLFMEKMKANGGFSKETLAKWKAAGFQIFYPATRAGWVRTDDVIAMITRPEPFPEPAKEDPLE